MKHISFYNGCIIEDDVWFSNLLYNALMKMNLFSGKVEMVDKFPEVADHKAEIHRKTFLSDTKLIFIPYKCECIHIYDLISKSFDVINLPIEKYVVATAFLIDDRIWLFPMEKNIDILVYDLSNSVFIKMSKLTKFINKVSTSDVIFLEKSVVYYNGCFWIASLGQNYIYRVNLENSNQIEKFSLSKEFHIYGLDLFDEDDFYILSMDTSEILRWSPKNGIQNSWVVDLEDGDFDIIPFSNAIKANEKNIFVLPSKANNVFVLKKGKDTFEKLSYPDGVKRVLPYAMFVGYEIGNNELILFPRGVNALLKVSLKTFEVKKVDFVLEKSLELYEKKIENCKIHNELYGGSLDDALGIQHMDLFIDEVVNAQSIGLESIAEGIGESIFKHAFGIVEE